MLQKLESERGRLLRQIEALQNELRGLDRAIALCSSEDGQPKLRSKNVKETVQKLMEEAGLIGATVDEIMLASRNVGVHLEKQTVAANLSRGKAAGVYDLRDGRYFFRARPNVTPATGWGAATVN